MFSLAEVIVWFLLYNIILLYTLCYASQNIRLYVYATYHQFFGQIASIVDTHYFKNKYFDELKKYGPECGDNKVKILEIGPAAGYNFKFYPDNTELTALDYNVNFKSAFIKNANKHDHVHLDNYIVADIEDMSMIEDNTFDIVLGTYVLCFVKDQDKAVKEILRVLKKGGKYYFLEHVTFKNTILAGLMRLIQLVHRPISLGDHVARRTWQSIERAGFTQIRINDDFWGIPHIAGFATK